MNKFGFTISVQRQIDFGSNKRDIAEYIFEREPSFRVCIECGCCTATCTTGQYTSFSLREIHVLIKRGEHDKVLKNINKCMLCGKCSLVCPRGVNTRNIVSLAREAIQIRGKDAV